MRLLVKELGADVAAKGKDDCTALHLAASYGHHEAVRVLVKELGVDVAPKDKDGYTALHLAAKNDHHEVTILLRDK